MDYVKTQVPKKRTSLGFNWHHDAKLEVVHGRHASHTYVPYWDVLGVYFKLTWVIGITSQSVKFCGEFQELCEKTMIYHHTISQYHIEANMLIKWMV
jgi:hypothetical protein